MKAAYKIDLPQHLADCEANYRRLLLLMPQWQQQNVWKYLVGNTHKSESGITIKVEERAKFTTTVHIFQSIQLQTSQPYVKTLSNQYCNSYDQIISPDLSWLYRVSPRQHHLLVRLYHDADLAEVISCERHRQFRARYHYPNRYMYQRDEKARLNSFLGELLGHCLANGRVDADVFNS